MKEGLLNQARVFSMASQEILPLLEEQKENAYAALLNDFNQGEKDLVAHVAKLSAIQELIDDIESKIKLYNHEVTKENAQ